MADYALPLLDLELGASALALAVPTIPVPTLGGEQTTWEVWASNRIGTLLGLISDVTVDTITWRLNAWREAQFTVSLDAENLDLLPLPHAGFTPSPEVKIFRNGHLIFWGPVISRRADSGSRQWVYQAGDPLWYLTGRNMGEAERHNYVEPSSFDDNTSLGTWSLQTGPGSTVTVGIDNTRYLLGGGSVQIEADQSDENYIRKTFTVTSGSLGLALFLTAWVYVDAFTFGAFANRGAFLGRLFTAPGTPGAFGWSTIDENTPLGTWLRMSCHVNMPPNRTETIDARLYSPLGRVHWDGVSVTIMESLGFVNENSPGGTGWDQTLIAQLTAKYLAGSMVVGNPYTKSRLELTVDGAPSGVKAERVYQFFDARPGYEGGVGNGALDEWPRAQDGFDYRIDYDSGTVRTFRTYYPAVGRLWDDAMITGAAPAVHSAFQLERIIAGNENVGAKWAINGWEYGETIDGSATNIRELGQGDDSGREEGNFSDPAALGDLTIELVEAAPADAPLDALDRLAKQRGAQIAKRIATPILRMVEPKDPDTGDVLVPLIDELLPGDLIPVILNDASVAMFGIYRVTAVQLNCSDESLSVALAP